MSRPTPTDLHEPMTYRILLVVLSLAFATAARAQEAAQETAPADGCKPEAFDLMATDLSAFDAPAPAASGEALTEAERRVQEIVAADGVHVVHFWAPWCDNSTAELRAGWYELVEQNPGVTFTFVTVWNDGETGRAVLDRYAVPDRVVELAQPDHGPSTDKTQRRRQFLGLPLTWIPSTWIYHDNGALAFALNAGEMEMETLQHLLDAATKDWTRD